MVFIAPCVTMQAETAYTKSVLRDTDDLQEQLYKEMRSRVPQADQEVPQWWAPASLPSVKSAHL